jgi:omega-6 fatty acid desaturase (delta-12 desaturase)
LTITPDEPHSDGGPLPPREETLGPLLAARFRAYGADARRSILQLVTTGAAFLALLVGMAVASRGHYWLTLLLAIPTAGLLVRLFIIQHD